MKISGGSPPRAWGIRLTETTTGIFARFTPTCVGNTNDITLPMSNRWFTPTCVGNTPPCVAFAPLPAVHPHVRGEYTSNDPTSRQFGGSPPRAWGIRCRAASTCSISPVHPHVRGEYGVVYDLGACSCGSPPRAWGIPAVHQVAHGGRRFTPTCVGNTYTEKTSGPEATVHPHVRGEYASSCLASSSSAGSPPRAWGIQQGEAVWAALGSVHPHVRGEYEIRARDNHLHSGSPPRAWGIPVNFPTCTDTLRFTPTCVGNTTSTSASTAATSVHPHVRGEYCCARTAALFSFGSPPRAWGILIRSRLEARGARFTPTCVGNTTFIFLLVLHPPVHPHVRGEYIRLSMIHQAISGSPPRAWGIL